MDTQPMEQNPLHALQAYEQALEFVKHCTRSQAAEILLEIVDNHPVWIFPPGDEMEHHVSSIGVCDDAIQIRLDEPEEYEDEEHDKEVVKAMHQMLTILKDYDDQVCFDAITTLRAGYEAINNEEQT